MNQESDGTWLLGWAPIKIDALGLVTLLGAEEINKKLGQLCVSRITEFLPLVGSHVVADNSFASPLNGFTVYNITDGICATDVVGWFARWLLCQKLTYNSTTLIVGTVLSVPGRQGDGAPSRLGPAALLGVVVSAGMVTLAAVIRDWWGLTNAVALALSAAGRFAILWAMRDAVDRAADRAAHQSTAVVKTFWKLPDGACVVVYTTRGILTECLLTTPWPAWPRAYAAGRAVAWTAFLVHILSLGMAALPSQLACIAVLALSTLSAVLSLGIRSDLVGSRLQIRRTDHTGWQAGSMAAMFARLDLSSDEEQSMVDWQLMPLRRNRVWWEKYRDLRMKDTPAVFEAWTTKESWEEFERRFCQS
ncbi:hypothetical protein MFIFM68171_00077 [Madurella fahalii]|uniref:Uncharacterized protein n=1 Tax=Madurella fahalii TaxID=1157608 RepID=A0ABQ0FWJ3_9PEZI